MIKNGHVLEIAQNLKTKTIDCIITSPPYWGLRDYSLSADLNTEEEAQKWINSYIEKTNPEKNVYYIDNGISFNKDNNLWLGRVSILSIWDGDRKCHHEFGEDIPMTRKSNWDTFKFTDGRNDSSNDGWRDKVIKSKTTTHGKLCRKCNAWKGQLGVEPNPTMYVDHLFQIFEALKPTLVNYGSLWVNLGDTHAGGGNASGHTEKTTNLGKTTTNHGFVTNPVARNVDGVRNKSLILIPYLFAIKMVYEGNWICRNIINWHKTNPMPSSAKDRFTVDFEPWFLFVKEPNHYFEQQFENMKNMKSGRNMRTTWTITNHGYSDAHFATFPEKLVITPIKAGCPELVCTRCGEPVIKLYEPTTVVRRIASDRSNVKQAIGKTGSSENPYKSLHEDSPRRINYSKFTTKSCNCKVDFRKGIVLDPFFGSGTVGIVAENLGRDFLGIEINDQYISIAQKRIITNRRRLALQEKVEFQRNRI